MANIEPKFYDVPCVGNVAEKTGRMAYAIFSDEEAARQFARAKSHTMGIGFPLQVNFRPWAEFVFYSSRILDYRKQGVSNGTY